MLQEKRDDVFKCGVSVTRCWQQGVTSVREVQELPCPGHSQIHDGQTVRSKEQQRGVIIE